MKFEYGLLFPNILQSFIIFLDSSIFIIQIPSFHFLFNRALYHIFVQRMAKLDTTLKSYELTSIVEYNLPINFIYLQQQLCKNQPQILIAEFLQKFLPLKVQKNQFRDYSLYFVKLHVLLVSYQSNSNKIFIFLFERF